MLLLVFFISFYRISIFPSSRSDSSVKSRPRLGPIGQAWKT